MTHCVKSDIYMGTFESDWTFMEALRFLNFVSLTTCNSYSYQMCVRGSLRRLEGSDLIGSYQ